MSYLLEYENPKRHERLCLIEPSVIMQCVAKEFEIPYSEIGEGKAHKVPLAATAVCAYIMREVGGMTWLSIAKLLRRKDHSTTSNLVKICRRKMDADEKYANAIGVLIEDIKKENAEQLVNALT